MKAPRWHSSRPEREAVRLRGRVLLLVLVLLATRVVWLPAHLAFVAHCPPTGAPLAHDERGSCADGHHHEPDGDHECHTAVEHELAMVVMRGEVDLEPAGLAPPSADAQRLHSIALARRALETRSLTGPDPPPPGARRGRAPPA